MFTHDPYQSYSNWGAYPTGAAQFGLPYSPYTALQNPGVNPAAAYNPVSGIPGYGGIHPQLLHAASILATQLATQAAIQQQQLQNPLLAAVYQNPQLAATLQQNPLAANIMQNPLAAAFLQNPLLNPMLTQSGIPTLPQVGPQTHLQHPQIGQMAGLQPQSWVGQGGLGGGQPFGPQQFGGQPFSGQPFGAQQFGAIHPLLLAQLGVRAGQTPGINPWGGY